jgi:hypothetical protein
MPKTRSLGGVRFVGKMKTFRSIIRAGFASVILLTFTAHLQANVIPFTRITANALDNVGVQLSATVSIVDTSHVQFSFFNTSAIASSITDIYFDDGGVNMPSILDNISSIANHNTSYESDAQPANLPGGNNLTPAFSAKFSGQSKNQPPTIITNGVNQSTDSVDFIFLLKPSKTFSDVVDGLNSGLLRIGLRVQGIPILDGTTSDSFINSGSSSVPEPATIILLCLGGLLLIRKTA